MKQKTTKQVILDDDYIKMIQKGSTSSVTQVRKSKALQMIIGCQSK